jgi:hypothetical protein
MNWLEIKDGHLSSIKDPVTLKQAFEKSTEKWTAIAGNPNLYYDGIKTCGLCNLYFFTGCKRCPIFAKTERSFCSNFNEFSDFFYCRTSANARKVIKALKKLEAEYELA